MSEPSGVPGFDELLEGGLERGDNVVWIGQTASDVVGMTDAFLATGTALHRHICLSTDNGCEHPGGPQVLHPLAQVDGLEPDELRQLLLADDVTAGSRVVVSALDDMVTRWGAARTIELYRSTCPALFDRGAIACWAGGRDLVGAAVMEGIGRIAQCVFELRDDRVRIIKAEGRPSRLQGVVARVDRSAEPPVVSREHTVGRLGEGLRRIRRERSLTQAQLAAIAGVTPAAVSQTETGRRGLSLDTIVPMCEVLGIGLDDLLGTGRSQGPFLARHDRNPPSGTSVALFEDPDVGRRAHLVRLAAGQTSSPPYVPRGPELVLVAEGLVMVDLGDTTPVLRAGDGLLATEGPIRNWTNLNSAPARLFWVTD